MIKPFRSICGKQGGCPVQGLRPGDGAEELLALKFLLQWGNSLFLEPFMCPRPGFTISSGVGIGCWDGCHPTVGGFKEPEIQTARDLLRILKSPGTQLQVWAQSGSEGLYLGGGGVVCLLTYSLCTDCDSFLYQN